MTATVIVRLPSGATRRFNAISCRVEFGFVTATGQWSSAPRTSGTFTWGPKQVVEVRHGA